MDVGVAQAREPRGRGGRQRAHPLHGVHLGGNAGHHRRAIARAGADLEDTDARLESGGRGHRGHDVRLGDGLAVPDGQRAIVVRAIDHRGPDEALAWNLAHRLQHERVGDAPRHELGGDHAPALGLPHRGTAGFHSGFSSTRP